jgi:hypothetical protein
METTQKWFFEPLFVLISACRHSRVFDGIGRFKDIGIGCSYTLFADQFSMFAGAVVLVGASRTIPDLHGSIRSKPG